VDSVELHPGVALGMALFIINACVLLLTFQTDPWPFAWAPGSARYSAAGPLRRAPFPRGAHQYRRVGRR
jgi:hypothetical protein